MAKTFRISIAAIVCVIAGVIVTPPAMRLALHGDAWGIGDPTYMPLLYPYSVLATNIGVEVMLIPALILMAAQFPIYGLLIGEAASGGAKRLTLTLAGIAFTHGIAMAICRLMM